MPVSSGPAGIVVFLICDVDESQESRQILKEDYGREYTAEELCFYAAEHLNIGTLASHMYALASPDLEMWYPANHKIKCEADNNKSFVFRIRFLPPTTDSSLSRLYRIDKDTFDYLYLQCRYDYINDRLTYKEHDNKGKKIGPENLLGLGVIDMLRHGKERNLDLAKCKALEPHEFILRSSRKSFKNFLDRHKLSMNFKPVLEREYKACGSDKPEEVKLRYMRALFSYTRKYCMETFHSTESNYKMEISVDPYDSEAPGISLVIHMHDSEAHDKPMPKHFAKIEELMDVSIADNQPGRIHMNRKTGMPQVINMENKEKALSFVSLLYGYYRLREDFHHSLCISVESPSFATLKSMRSHGPVSKPWAKQRLQDRHKQSKEFNHLLFQRNKHNGFVLAHISAHSPNTVNCYQIEKDGPDYYLTLHSDARFQTMRALLDHYKSTDSPIWLDKCVPPTAVDPAIYLCRDRKEIEQSVAKQPKHHRAPVALVSDVDVISPLVYSGHLTDIHKGSLGKNNVYQTVAIKQLKKQPPYGALEMFLDAVNKAAFWSHPTLVTIHDICLSSPPRVLMELADYGNLEQYLRQPALDVKPQHLVTSAEQLAQALFYLQEERVSVSGIGEVHGNIRCKNILVFKHDRIHGLKVKLADPGMVHLYNNLDMTHAYNKERFAWIAPERYNKMSPPDVYSDRYSFGITLWEMFALGDRPFNELSPDEIKTHLKNDKKDVLGQPMNCPDEIYRIMQQSWDLTPDMRPGMKDNVRNIRDVLQRHFGDADLNEYNDPDWRGVAEAGVHSVVPPSPGSACPLFNSGSSGLSSGVGRALADNAANQMAQGNAAMTASGQVVRASGASRNPSVSSIYGSNVPLLPPSSSTSSASDLGVAVAGSATTIDTTMSESTATPTNSGATFPIPGPPSRQQSIQARPLPALPRPSEEEQRRMKQIEPLQRERVIYDKRSQPLGKGHYGEVFKGLFETDNGNLKPVAIKFLKPKMYHKYQAEFEKEFRIMVELQHDNIVNVIGQCPQRDAETPMLLVMEFVSNGCLRDFLKNATKTYKGKALHALQMQLCREIAAGMKYLGDNNIVHRDLAARNVLVTSERHAKISDFGLSHTLGQEKDYYRGDQHKDIPAPWCAPEALLERKFSTLSDVWSFGITVWEVFSYPDYPELCEIGKLPTFLHGGKRLGKNKGTWPPGMYDLILHSCWEYEATKRRNFDELLELMRPIELEYSRKV